MVQRPGFPIPRITEGFIDLVIESMGGHRLTQSERAFEQQANADYILPGGVVELKIIEEEPLEKAERQDRIARFFASKYELPPEVDIDFGRLNEDDKVEYLRLVAGPVQRAIKKASAQIRATKAHLGYPSHFGVLIAINNGFVSLPHKAFDQLVRQRAKNDATQIHFTLTTSVAHHRGGFDTLAFCESGGFPVREDIHHPYLDPYSEAVEREFMKRMSDMMADQMGWFAKPGEVLQPVKDIFFERNGVRFVREAPAVPDSRFRDPASQ